MPSQTSTSLHKVKPHIIHYLGPCASFLCLVHCFGFALLSALAPGILKFFPHSEWLEVGVLFSSAIFGGLSFSVLKPKRSIVLSFFAFFVLGAFSLFIHSHPTFHIATLSMALIQVGLTLYRHVFEPRTAKVCCEHEVES